MVVLEFGEIQYRGDYRFFHSAFGDQCRFRGYYVGIIHDIPDSDCGKENDVWGSGDGLGIYHIGDTAHWRTAPSHVGHHWPISGKDLLGSEA